MSHILGSGFTSNKQDTYMEGPFYYRTSNSVERTPTNKQALNQNQLQSHRNTLARSHSAQQKDFKIRSNSGRPQSERSQQYQKFYKQNATQPHRVHYEPNNYMMASQNSARNQENLQKLSSKKNSRFLTKISSQQQLHGYPKTIKEAYKLRAQRGIQQEQNRSEVLKNLSGQAEQHHAQAALNHQQNNYQENQQVPERTPKKMVVKKKKQAAASHQQKPKEDIPQSIFHSEEAFKRLLIKQYKDTKESDNIKPKKFKDIGVTQSLSNFLFQKNPQKSGNYDIVNSHGELIKSQYKPGYSQKVYKDQMIISYIPCLQGQTMVSPKGVPSEKQVDMYQTAASSIGFHSNSDRKATNLCRTPNTRYCSTPKKSDEVQNIPMLGTTQSLSSLKQYLAQRQAGMLLYA